ncbi:MULTISPECIES: glycosyltransferase [Corallococcus]|uniref:glycosyltransferase n=1 Tax=Corallococcus TaxID=83461 RepID=UPI00117F79FA|nr:MULTISPECIES: glycosyltransferase [Corallococcus]NBD12489.1 glycosyltransferase [Corallococcus silvisoli]TSC29437.1 glycosyltransferase [Corallococcus sp. Z5C101001]
MVKNLGDPYPIVRLEHYERYVGAAVVERILEKARPLQDLRVAHVNSTYYGGGVAELLSPLTLLMNSVGMVTEWRAIQGPPDFFNITKKMHNALQGADIHLTPMKANIYEEVVYENAIRNRLDHDRVVIHDPQPLPIVRYSRKRGPWTWRCHIDLSNPEPALWEYLKPFVEEYDAMVLSAPEYAQDLRTPQLFFMPAIDPFSIKNREMSEAEMDERLQHHHIPTDLPLVVQISRFDRWKDPEGVVSAWRLARKDAPCTLVLLGNMASDDPEGQEVYQEVMRHRDERIIILSREDTALVNALQRRAAVVVQKSLREGFGLTVAEAMWKSTPVIGGNVGGIRHQIEDGYNGFLVDSVAQCAARMVQLLKNPKLRRQMGHHAHETVRRRFLLTRYLEQYLDLFNAFETHYHLRPLPHLTT